MSSFCAATMFLAAAVLVYLAVGTFGNLWADHRDDPAATYLAVGALELAAAAASTFVGAWFVREGRHRDR